MLFHTQSLINKRLLSNAVQNIRTLYIRNFSEKRDYSSSDDENVKKQKEQKQTKQKERQIKDPKAVERLNELLASMQTDDNKLFKTVNIPKAGNKKINEKKKKLEVEKPKDIIRAMKDVAKSLGGDVKQTESELLSKLLDHSNGIDVQVSVSETGTDSKQLNLNDLIVGMKIDRENKSEVVDSQTRTQYVKRALQKAGVKDRSQSKGHFRDTKSTNISRPENQIISSVNLFGSQPLGIFKNIEEHNDSPDILEIWNKLKQKDLKLSVTHPPSNYFQKMMLWTDQGKIWKFPIDNEQGFEEEKQVYFTEHIFLEQHLESWCPKIGPIRHFMELVCVGLSKNPYITVKDKQEHINWFKSYFQEKNEMLKDLIVEQNKDNNVKKELEI